jgi:hypothetical protein
MLKVLVMVTSGAGTAYHSWPVTLEKVKPYFAETNSLCNKKHHFLVMKNGSDLCINRRSLINRFNPVTLVSLSQART